MKIRTILADDELLARDRLRFLLQQDTRIELLTECRNAREAAAAVAREHPDLLLLDIEMPGQSGIELLGQLETEHVPFTIFVTAYPQYATKAFDLEVLDYLVKPIEAERLRLSIDRVVRRIEQGKAAATPHHIREALQILAQAQNKQIYPARLLVPNGTRQTFINVEEIDWLEAADYYTCLHFGRSKLMMRQTLSQLAETLNPTLFLRVHRSAVINVARVREVVREGRSAMYAILKDGQRVKLNRSGWDALCSPGKQQSD